MPAEVKALRKFASDDPTDSIRTVMRGPRPASSVEPVRLPMGMDRSPVGTWLDAGQDRVQNLRLQVVEGRHVAAAQR